MKTEQQIDYIYTQLGKYWPKYANKKPAAKIHKQAYTSPIGVQSFQHKVKTKELLLSANNYLRWQTIPEDMIKLSQEQPVEAIRPWDYTMLNPKHTGNKLQIVDGV